MSAAARQRAPPAAAGRARVHTLLQLLAACTPGACAAACVVFGVSARWPCSPHCPPPPLPPPATSPAPATRSAASPRTSPTPGCPERTECALMCGQRRMRAQQRGNGGGGGGGSLAAPRRVAPGRPHPNCVFRVAPVFFPLGAAPLRRGGARAARLATVFRPTQAPARRCGPPGRTLRSALPQNTFEPFAPSLSLPQSLCGT